MTPSWSEEYVSRVWGDCRAHQGLEVANAAAIYCLTWTHSAETTTPSHTSLPSLRRAQGRVKLSAFTCMQTWRLGFFQDASRLQKKVRLSNIRRQVTRASQEIHVLHTELFQEEQGKACSCVLHLTTHFTVFQRLPRLYKAVAQVLC